MRLKRLLLLTAFFLTAGAFWACAPPAATPAPLVTRAVLSATPAPPRTWPGLSLEDCTVEGTAAKCGTLQVYEDRLSRTGRQISLQVAVVPAQADWNFKPDAVFFFAGGPGASIMDMLPGYARQYSTTNLDRDLVFVEQRGVGQSHRLACPTFDPAVSAEQQARQCLAGLDGDPRFYTTAMAVDDFDDARQALGYDQINLVGGSYGGTVVQVYLLRHQAHVRSATIEHATLLKIPFMSALPRSSQIGLEHLFARCEKDPACARAYPELRQDWEGLQFRLSMQPVISSVTNPQSGKPVILDQDSLAATVHNLLLSTDSAMRLPRLIHQAYVSDDFDEFAREWLHLADVGRSTAGLIMHHEILCFEPWAAGSVDDMKKSAPASYYLGPAITSLEQRETICSWLPPPPPGAIYAPQTGSRVPVLVLVGELDPQNPLENMAGVKTLWPNAQVVVEPGQGHSATMTPCRWQMANAFIANPLKALNTACLSEGQPAFDIQN